VSAWPGRRYVLAILIGGATLLTPIARGDNAPEQRILGMWLTPDKDGVIEFFLTAAGKVAGRIVAGSSGPERLDDKNPSPGLRTRRITGAVILQGFRYAGDGKWTDGTVYNPDNGKTYRCDLELTTADTLSVHGYVGLLLFGRSELWTRKK
jgi:uncharacterized protein (DUF2147 family)